MTALTTLTALAALVILTIRVQRWRRLRGALARHPELARRFEASRTMSLRLTPELLFEPPERFPAPVHDIAHPEAPPRWSTYGALTLSAFPRATAPAARRPGVVRVVLLGDSVLFGDVHARVESLLDRSVGAGRAEVLNLSVPGAQARTMAFVADRFLPELQPDVIVVYTGRNDIVLSTAWARAVIALGLGLPIEESFPSEGSSQNVRSLVGGRWSPWEVPAQRRWIEGSARGLPLNHLWSLARLSWRLGADLVLSTYAGPAPGEISSGDLDFYNTEIELFWPVLGELRRYDAARTALNDGIREMSRRVGARLADADAAMRGGRTVFRDMCHTTPTGTDRLVETLAASVAPLVRARSVEGRHGGARGVPNRVWSSRLPAPTAHPGDGTCMQGPCPEGACFVPGGAYVYGYPPEALEAATRFARARYGFAQLHEWYGDEGPANTVRLSPFCLDRTEVTREVHQRCVAAGACPPFDDSGMADGPAMLPTWDEADALCRWRGGRLPTDAEWEAAARGPNGRRFPWGERWTGWEANYCGRECPWAAPGDPTDGHLAASPPGGLGAPSPFGLRDMAGNHWEFVRDCFDNEIHHQLSAGAVDPMSEEQPRCRRTLRGGSYASLPVLLEKRTPEGSPDTPVESRGARCAYYFGAAPPIER
jgi:formylglycine-generating enzyme required for sulfatase activity